MIRTINIPNLISVLFGPLLLLVSSSSALPPDASSWAQPRAVKHGAVACESKVCSDIGGDIFRLGGSAADAMIATVLCVGVIDAHHSGIGASFALFSFYFSAPSVMSETLPIVSHNVCECCCQVPSTSARWALALMDWLNTILPFHLLTVFMFRWRWFCTRARTQGQICHDRFP